MRDAAGEESSFAQRLRCACACVTVRGAKWVLNFTSRFKLFFFNCLSYSFPGSCLGFEGVLIVT